MDGIMMMESLSQAPWSVVARTHGNTHATLTGLVVNWWVGLSPRSNWALDGGLSLGKSGRANKGKSKSTGKEKSGASASGNGHCDAVLCLKSDPVGVVKVESGKKLTGIDRLESLLAAEQEELRSVRFAVLALHAYEPTGRGDARKIAPVATPETLERVARISARFPEKPLLVIAVESRYERIRDGVRSLNEHYWGTAVDVQGILFQGGHELMRRPYDMSVLELEPVL